MKLLKKLGALVLCSCVAFGAASCKGETLTGFALPHFDASETEEYDTELLYKNNSNLLGGDGGIIWVSEEQGGEEYGGYFYQYMSATRYAINRPVGGFSGSPIKEDGTPALTKDEAAYVGHLILTRSKDLILKGNIQKRE